MMSMDFLLAVRSSMFIALKLLFSPSTLCSCPNALCACLLVALLLPSPSLCAVAWALPGRDGKAGSPIEPESWICDVAARATASRSVSVKEVVAQIL